MKIPKAWLGWSRLRVISAVAGIVVVGFLCGQVASAERFTDAVRVIARLLQLGLGAIGLYFVFSWASDNDRRRRD